MISDTDFLNDSALGKSGGLWLYSLYVGWVPVLLGLYSLTFIDNENRKPIVYMVLIFGFGIIAASGEPFKSLSQWYPAMSFVRWPPIISSLAVPGLLGLVSVTVHRIWNYTYPHLSVEFGLEERRKAIRLNVRWLLLIPLVFSIQFAYKYSSYFIATTSSNELIYNSVQSLKTNSAQWVATPFGEHFWIEPSIDNQVKLTNVVWAWNWANRAMPEAKLLSLRDGVPDNGSIIGTLGKEDSGINIYI